MANYILQGQPCTPDCPNRQPGCNCQKRKEWVVEKNERKQKIYEEKSKANRVAEIRNPPRAQKLREK